MQWAASYRTHLPMGSWRVVILGSFTWLEATVIHFSMHFGTSWLKFLSSFRIASGHLRYRLGIEQMVLYVCWVQSWIAPVKGLWSQGWEKLYLSWDPWHTLIVRATSLFGEMGHQAGDIRQLLRCQLLSPPLWEAVSLASCKSRIPVIFVFPLLSSCIQAALSLEYSSPDMCTSAHYDVNWKQILNFQGRMHWILLAHIKLMLNVSLMKVLKKQTKTAWNKQWNLAVTLIWMWDYAVKGVIPFLAAFTFLFCGHDVCI